MSIILEVSIVELWLDEEYEKMDQLISGMNIHQIRELQHILLGLIDYLASRER